MRCDANGVCVFNGLGCGTRYVADRKHAEATKLQGQLSAHLSSVDRAKERSVRACSTSWRIGSCITDQDKLM